jgi:hypothetical protein
MSDSESWVNVGVDARDCLKDLKGIAKEQFPYAYASALTKTAGLCQIAVQIQTRKVFELHTEYIPRGIMVERAKKKDIQTMKMAFAAVFTSDAITPFMVMHETGGTKHPVGRALALPGEGLRGYRFKTASGAVKTSWRPATLLHAYKGGKKAKPFLLPARGNEPERIARRKGKNTYPIEILYVFRPKAEIKPEWEFEKTVREVAPKMFPMVFEEAFSNAIQTRMEGI